MELWSMKKPAIKAHDPEVISPVENPACLKKMTSIADVLVQPSWSDGEPKGESALMIFRKGATGYRVILKVETPPLMLSAPGLNLDDALACLEALLRSDDVPWVQDVNPLGRRAGKGRRAS